MTFEESARAVIDAIEGGCSFDELENKHCPALRDALSRFQIKMTDEEIADLWHLNGGFHHHFGRAVERLVRNR